MTIIQKRKVLTRISEVETEIAELKKARAEIAANGYQSASTSSGGGSKSYSHLSLDQLTKAINALVSEMTKLQALLDQDASIGSGLPGKKVLVVYS